MSDPTSLELNQAYIKAATRANDAEIAAARLRAADLGELAEQVEAVLPFLRLERRAAERQWRAVEDDEA
jgi:hypothetical protein